MVIAAEPPGSYPTRMTPTERMLTWLMRVNAAILLTAVVPVFFPTDLMADLHARLGLGEFPRDRLTDYLTRSAAACYALHGAVVLLVSTDVPRYRPLITPLYGLHLMFAGAMLGIDLFAGMPVWWTVAEVGTIGGFAAVALAVNRRARLVWRAAGSSRPT